MEMNKKEVKLGEISKGEMNLDFTKDEMTKLREYVGDIKQPSPDDNMLTETQYDFYLSKLNAEIVNLSTCVREKYDNDYDAEIDEELKTISSEIITCVEKLHDHLATCESRPFEYMILDYMKRYPYRNYEELHPVLTGLKWAVITTIYLDTKQDSIYNMNEFYYSFSYHVLTKITSHYQTANLKELLKNDNTAHITIHALVSVYTSIVMDHIVFNTGLTHVISSMSNILPACPVFRSLQIIDIYLKGIDRDVDHTVIDAYLDFCEDFTSAMKSEPIFDTEEIKIKFLGEEDSDDMGETVVDKLFGDADIEENSIPLKMNDIGDIVTDDAVEFPLEDIANYIIKTITQVGSSYKSEVTNVGTILPIDSPEIQSILNYQYSDIEGTHTLDEIIMILQTYYDACIFHDDDKTETFNYICSALKLKLGVIVEILYEISLQESVVTIESAKRDVTLYSHFTAISKMISDDIENIINPSAKPITNDSILDVLSGPEFYAQTIENNGCHNLFEYLDKIEAYAIRYVTRKSGECNAYDYHMSQILVEYINFINALLEEDIIEETEEENLDEEKVSIYDDMLTYVETIGYIANTLAESVTNPGMHMSNVELIKHLICINEDETRGHNMLVTSAFNALVELGMNESHMCELRSHISNNESKYFDGITDEPIETICEHTLCEIATRVGADVRKFATATNSLPKEQYSPTFVRMFMEAMKSFDNLIDVFGMEHEGVYDKNIKLK